MRKKKNLYTCDEWIDFSWRVRQRDGEKCLKCHRSPPEVVLQVHHEIYVPGKRPWEYALSDCTTVCKGCHAREHNLVEPSRGWCLVSIDDLGGLHGTCEREGCGRPIRYEHLTYHPRWGYKKVGSTCIDYLTTEDQDLSGEILSVYSNISRFVHRSTWGRGKTRAGKDYIVTRHSRHDIRIYGRDGFYAFQIALKAKGVPFRDHKEVVPAKGKSLEEVKELAYITLQGLTTRDKAKKEQLRHLYRSIMCTKPQARRLQAERG